MLPKRNFPKRIPWPKFSHYLKIGIFFQRNVIRSRYVNFLAVWTQLLIFFQQNLLFLILVLYHMFFCLWYQNIDLPLDYDKESSTHCPILEYSFVLFHMEMLHMLEELHIIFFREFLTHIDEECEIFENAF